MHERRLAFDHVVDPWGTSSRERFQAVTTAIRQVRPQSWVRTLRD